MEIKKQVTVKFSEKELFAIDLIEELIGEMLEYIVDNKIEFTDYTYEDLNTTYDTLCDLSNYGR